MKKNSQTKRYFPLKIHLLWVTVGVIVVSQVFFALQAVTSSSKLVELEEELKTQLARNEELKNRLVDATSLIQLTDKAESLGFKRIEKTLYIKTDEQFARLP